MLYVWVARIKLDFEVKNPLTKGLLCFWRWCWDWQKYCFWCGFDDDAGIDRGHSAHRMAAGGTEDILSNWYHLGCPLSTLVSSSFELVPSSFRAIFLATCDTVYNQLQTLSKSNVPLGTLALEDTEDNKKKRGGTTSSALSQWCGVVFDDLLICCQADGCWLVVLDLCVFSFLVGGWGEHHLILTISVIWGSVWGSTCCCHVNCVYLFVLVFDNLFFRGRLSSGSLFATSSVMRKSAAWTLRSWRRHLALLSWYLGCFSY